MKATRLCQPVFR